VLSRNENPPTWCAGQAKEKGTVSSEIHNKKGNQKRSETRKKKGMDGNRIEQQQSITEHGQSASAASGKCSTSEREIGKKRMNVA
jgi:hypothetical protein